MQMKTKTKKGKATAKRPKEAVKSTPPPPIDDNESDEGSSSSGDDTESSVDDEHQEPTPPGQATSKKMKRAAVEENGDGDEIESNDRKKPKKEFFAADSFSSLPLSDNTQTALATMGFTQMTKIQSLSIPALLSGKDLIGAAKTGSGKTLAFLLPVVELLHNAKFGSRNGTGAIVISPTRELAMQIYGVCKDLCTNGKHHQTYGLIMGGANRRTEAERLAKGVNIIIATPGRLLDHLQNTKGFVFRNLLAFVMDEADVRILLV